MQLTAKDEAFLKGVHPDLVKVIREAARITTVPLKLTEGLRSVARQRELVRKGFSKTMNSRHLSGHAVDLVPMVDVNGDGKIDSQEMYSWPLYYKLAPIIKQAALNVGVTVEWGGDWKSFKDGPHWQLPYKTYPAAVQAQGIMGLQAIDYEEACSEEPYDGETEQAAHGKTVAAVASGAGLGVTVGYDPVAKIVDVLTAQQGELSSGDVIKTVIAVVIVGISLWYAWRKS